MSRRAKTISDLGSIVEAGRDAVTAYEVAIERICDFRRRHRLSEFISDHHRHVQRVEREISRLGGSPARKLRMRLIVTARVYLAEVVGGGRGILEVLRLSEASVAQRYEALLADESLSSDLRKVLRQDLEDVQRHRAWLAVELHRDERRAA